MCSGEDTHRWVGCPIRMSTDQRLLAAPRGFSQRATSFIASWCQGIHRMPLSYSIRGPGFEPGAPGPGAARSDLGRRARHAQKPSSGRLGGGRGIVRWKSSSLRTQHDPARPMPRGVARATPEPQARHDRSHASEPSPPTAGARASRHATPGQTSDRTTGPPPIHSPQTWIGLGRTRPETHQNLIHPDKDQRGRHSGRTNGVAANPGRFARAHAQPNSNIRDTDQTPRPPQGAVALVETPWWRRSGSNRRPPACKAGALPAELRPRTRSTPRRANRPARPWTGHRRAPARANPRLVGQGGFEPPTPRLSSVCSNQLSY